MNVTQNPLLTGFSKATTTAAVVHAEQLPLHCTRGSLTSSYGWMVQGILASVAFTCLIGTRVLLVAGTC